MEELKARICELENEIKLLKEANQLMKQSKNAEVITSSCKCEICGKELKNKYILKTHMKLHQDKESIKQQCPICQKFYCSKYYLSKHMRQKHEHKNTNESRSKGAEAQGVEEAQNINISSDSNSDVSSNEITDNKQ